NEQGWGQADDPDRWQVTLQVAFSALKRAEGLLDSGQPTTALREQVRAARAELEEAEGHCALAADLDRARMLKADAPERVWPITKLLEDSLEVLKRHGLDIREGDPDSRVAKLRGHRLRERLMQTLWECEMWTAEEERGPLSQLMEAVDPEADSFRQRLRKGFKEQDLAALVGLRVELAGRAFPAAAYLDLSVTLRAMKDWENGQLVLRDGLKRYPGDFWLNFELGLVLRSMGRSDQAIRYMAAATALRPRSALTHYNLGLVLNDT